MVRGSNSIYVHHRGRFIIAAWIADVWVNPVKSHGCTNRIILASSSSAFSKNPAKTDDEGEHENEEKSQPPNSGRPVAPVFHPVFAPYQDSRVVFRDSRGLLHRQKPHHIFDPSQNNFAASQNNFEMEQNNLVLTETL